MAKSVREIATLELATVEPEQDLHEALALMVSDEVRRLPVGEVVEEILQPTTTARE